jgi:hypothetical protein
MLVKLLNPVLIQKVQLHMQTFENYDWEDVVNHLATLVHRSVSHSFC